MCDIRNEEFTKVNVKNLNIMAPKDIILLFKARTYPSLAEPSKKTAGGEKMKKK
jgi:hypothetical protein